MQRGSLITVPLAFFVASLSPVGCLGQTPSPPASSSPAGSPSSSAGDGLPRFGIALSAGTLGAGIQAATAVAHKSNLRFGFNYFSYSGSVTRSSDNITFNGKLRLESAELLFDQYIVSGFHVSGGMMVYDGNQGNASASVPAGQTMTLNDVMYYSSASNPVTGTGSIASRKYAPEILIGFGNLLPRSSRHFSANFEVGVAFQGSPNATLNLTGSACVNGPVTGCSPVNSNSSIQANILGEQNKINNALAPFKYYPVLRVSFGYKF
jgi:hypothetical protein